MIRISRYLLIAGIAKFSIDDIFRSFREYLQNEDCCFAVHPKAKL